MDLSDLPIKATKRTRIYEPIALFESLTLRGSIDNIWDPQADALRTWHANRAQADVMVQMNTGGGKTLVGLVIAQSLVIETKGRVVYACPTNQLVEQTAKRAAECGIDVTTYMQTKWTGDAFDTCSGPCITNYHAIFHGFSKFRKLDLKALVFDDAHVASNVIRNCFTLSFSQADERFLPLANLYRGVFAANSQIQQFEEALSGHGFSLLFVPMYEVKRQADVMRKLLADSGITEDEHLAYPWAHVKDSLNRCVVIISGMGIEITPPMLPLHTTPYFNPGVRRVYLTATLPSQVEFASTFGVTPGTCVAPGGKSGEAQRLFIFPAAEGDDEQHKEVCRLIQTEKACVITPSDQAANLWTDIGRKYDGRSGHAGIEQFAASTKADKLILAARYDGIDLPGKACRILILDGLPRGACLLDRFLDGTLRIAELRLAHLASRVVQAIGRIFRSNTDHGAVVACGTDLQRWFKDPNNQKCMPVLLQKQVQLGLALRRMVDQGKADYDTLLAKVLDGTPDWDKRYREFLDDCDVETNPGWAAWFTELILGEKDAYRMLWDGNFPAAADAYGKLAGAALEHDRRLAAWYRHWEGLCLDYCGKGANAVLAYTQAANLRSELGRPQVRAGLIVSGRDIVPGPQAKRIAVAISKAGAKLRAQCDEVRKRLTNGPDTKPAEQALKELGDLLGLNASRPDNEEHTGPDVLWQSPGTHEGVMLEAKTDKKPTSQYRKKDEIAQFDDHVRWAAKRFPGNAFRKVIVGPRLRVAQEANPADDLQVIGVEQFAGLCERLANLLEFVEAQRDEDVAISVEKGLREFGFLWPSCIDSLESMLAIDLQREATAEPGAGLG
ncbi:MAG: hypothetical protein BIFFINMI_00312 [Phycisphaerae bacterium]|nr:hypothetical protein [Phycisphaerae bacterium]